MTVTERSVAIPTGVRLAFGSEGYISQQVREFLGNPTKDCVTLLWTNDVDPNRPDRLFKVEDQQRFDFITLDIPDNCDRRSVTSLDGFGNGFVKTIVETRHPGVRLLRVEEYDSYQLHTVVYKLVRNESLRKYSRDWKNLQ